MNQAIELSVSIVAGLILLAAGTATAAWRARKRRVRETQQAKETIHLERDAFLEQVREIFEGRPPNLLTGEPAKPGLVPQLNEVQAQVQQLRDGQVSVTAVAAEAAENVKAIREELTRNGGSSTKDAAHQAARSAEAAAAEATKTKKLLQRHMENGVEIMDAGIHNDEIAVHNRKRIVSALDENGIEVTELRDDYKPYPPVDTGKDRPDE